ncbi:MAG: ABC transporter ATP-binding protein [Planctomycetota bacterium]
MDAVTPVQTNGLGYSYEDGTEALSDVSLAIRDGEKWGLIGANGAGKTTLLLLLAGLLRRTSGAIELFGTTVADDVPDSVRHRVGVVFPNPDDQLFSPTVFEDVVFGPLNLGVARDVAHDRTHAVLERVGLADFESRVPQHLSTGEKRTVAIATVLAMEPSLILFDEPTSGLDPHSRARIVDLIRTLDGTHIVATHDFDVVLEICDQVALLAEGKVVVTGTPREVLGNEKLLQEHGLIQPRWLPYLLDNTP